jgi:uncharacterized membrane protein (UPF0127 family)
MPVSWLMCDGRVLAAAEVADSLPERSKGLLGRDGFDGAMVLSRTRMVHTWGMRFPIDVAFCDRQMVVLDVATLRPWRMSMPRWRARAVVEAEAGAFGRWSLCVGDRLEVR